MVSALVLAGGSAKELAAVPAKGLVPVNGRPMVEYVVDALHRCPDIDRICVVMPVEYSFNRQIEEKLSIVLADGNLLEVLKAGINSLNTEDMVLAMSADIPLITPEAISDFLQRCSKRKADIYYSIVKDDNIIKHFPSVKRTYARVREGNFTGGNLILLKPQFVEKNIELIERVLESRKKPVRIVRILGISFLLRFVLGLLEISQIEKRIGKLTRSACAGIITPFAEIGLDVDKQSDLELVEVALAGGVHE
ncbi:MAG: nucleotidyltransferase family protein [Actinomycetota bacterium]